MAIDTTTSVDVQTLTPFKKFIMTIGNLPTSYLESMTYAELLMWFCNYLQETVIPTVNNNGSAVTELQGLYEQLQSYVNDYFDDLNVQTEINNKLDSMVEDGSFETILNPYLQSFNARLDLQDTAINAIETEVNSIASGSPAGVYATASALSTADPDHNKIYLVLEDGKWYYYDDGWTAGGVYQSTGLADNSVSYEHLDSLLKTTNPFNNLFEPAIVDNSMNWTYELSNNATLEIVDKPEGMNCDDEKVLKITLPNENAICRLNPKFKQQIEYGKTISFSHYIYFTNNGRSYTYYIYKGTSSYASLGLQTSKNKFLPINKPIENVQSNDNINIRFFNHTSTSQIFYIADNVAIYGNKSINKNIGYTENTLPKDIIPSFETPKVGVGFGDSIMEGFGVLTSTDKLPTQDCISIMAKELNTPIYNGGVGGARLSAGDCSFVEVVNSIVNNSWTTFNTHLNTLISGNANMRSAIVQYNKIQALDFDDVDFLLIAYGTNDWTAGRTLDNTNNPLDTNTICGALRYGVSQLLTNYPQLKIYVFTPCYRDHLGTNQDQTSDTYTNPTSGLKLTDVCDAIAETCKELHIPCKNMYYDSCLNQYTRDEYLSDYVHRNAKGYELMGKQYAKFVDSN